MQIHERGDRLECETALFEENCEQTWEKGSSGLVFHTDDAHWDAAQGDFHERTADALDVVPGDADAQCDWEAGTEDPDASFLESLQRNKMLFRGRRQGLAHGEIAARLLPCLSCRAPSFCY